MTAHLAGVQERLRAAGLAQAQAEARAVEERKAAASSQAGLAASLLALAALGGGGGLWLDIVQRASRAEASAWEATETLHEASLLLGRGPCCARGGDDALGRGHPGGETQPRALLTRPEVAPDLRARSGASSLAIDWRERDGAEDI